MMQSTMVKDLMLDQALRTQLYPLLRKILQQHGYASDEILHEKVVQCLCRYAGVQTEQDFLQKYAKTVLTELITRVSCSSAQLFLG